MEGGRPRGGGSTLSASPSSVSETPSSLRLQDVELEAQFCDGLRVLHNLLRASATISTSTSSSKHHPHLFPTPRSPVHHGAGGGAGGADEAAEEASMVDDESLASAVGLFLQYQEGDYTHQDHPPNLALVVLGGERGAGSKEENRRSSSRLSSVMALAQEAWKANAGLSQTAAMTRFLAVLEAAVPGWRDGVLPIQFPGFGGVESVGGRKDGMGEGEQHGRSRGTKKMTPRGLGSRGGN